MLETPTGPVAAVVRNASLSGMLLETEGRHRPGDRVAFALLGRRYGARVVSVHRGQVAIAFDTALSEREFRMLSQL